MWNGVDLLPRFRRRVFQNSELKHVTILQARRKVGTEKIYTLRKDVAVFIDGDFLGDDVDLIKYITLKYKIYVSKNFEQLGNAELINYLRAESELGVCKIFDKNILLIITVNNCFSVHSFILPFRLMIRLSVLYFLK